MDCFVASLLAMTKKVIRCEWRLNHNFPQHPAAIHLVFEVDHRRTREMPGQARTRSAAAHQFIDDNRMEVVHGVSLRHGRILPAETEFSKTALHLGGRKPDFLPPRLRAHVAIANDALGISSG